MDPVVFEGKRPTSSKSLGSPGGSEIKTPSANTGDKGSTPGPGRSHMPGNS